MISAEHRVGHVAHGRAKADGDIVPGYVHRDDRGQGHGRVTRLQPNQRRRNSEVGVHGDECE
eukprot:4862050-Pleurochrysis_carterae.AAC.1